MPRCHGLRGAREMRHCSGHEYQKCCACFSAGKKELVFKLLEAKKASGKTFTEIAKEMGLTNMYTAQLFHNQVRL